MSDGRYAGVIETAHGRLDLAGRPLVMGRAQGILHPGRFGALPDTKCRQYPVAESLGVVPTLQGEHQASRATLFSQTTQHRGELSITSHR